MDTFSRMEHLRHQIVEHEAKLVALKAELNSLESDANKVSVTNGTTTAAPDLANAQAWPLLPEEYNRYGRQMILPGIGLPGQLRLRAARVLVVGVGGLGCPAAMYLASAGVGTLGLVDGDVVELSNLHRQVLHSSEKLGMKKVDSAVVALRSINPHPNYITYSEHLNPISALDIFSSYDLILDCTDAPQTRYLISDAAVLCGKPFISASALKTDGQLMVLNHPPTPLLRQDGTPSGPCYRCIFPRPPPPESVVTCGEGGILGPVVGVMGILMALEAIKLIYSGYVEVGKGESLPLPLFISQSSSSAQHSMIMLTAAGSSPSTFRTIRLKGKRADCVTCGTNPAINAEHLQGGSMDYAVFCGAASPISLLGKEERIQAKGLSKLMQRTNQTSIEDQLLPNIHTSINKNLTPPHTQHPIIVDVRDEAQFSICSLPKSINIPWPTLQTLKATEDIDALSELKSRLTQDPEASIYTICRLGNDSQLAVRKLEQLGLGPRLRIRDVVGGFRAWKRDVDGDWPEY